MGKYKGIMQGKYRAFNCFLLYVAGAGVFFLLQYYTALTHFFFIAAMHCLKNS